MQQHPVADHRTILFVTVLPVVSKPNLHLVDDLRAKVLPWAYIELHIGLKMSFSQEIYV